MQDILSNFNENFQKRKTYTDSVLSMGGFEQIDAHTCVRGQYFERITI